MGWAEMVESIKSMPATISYNVKDLRKAVRDANDSAKILLVVGYAGLIALIIGSLSGITINSLLPNPNYAAYFLYSLQIVIVLDMGYMLVEAIVKENEFQLAAFLLQSLFMVIVTGYQMAPAVRGIIFKPNYVIILGLCVTSFLPFLIAVALFISFLGLSIPVFQSFGWKIFKHVGSNPKLNSAYRLYSIYVAMNKLDNFLVICVLVTNSFFLYFKQIGGYVGFALLFALSLAIPNLNIRIVVKKEIYSLHILFLLWSFAMPIFLLWRVIDMFITKDRIRFPANVPIFSNLSVIDPYLEVKIMMSIIIIIAILFRLSVIGVGIAATVNFRHGLQSVFLKQKERRRRMQKDPTSLENFLMPEVVNE
ncbi:golgi apparatus membrane protein [Acrasis kona]|uniref:Golgi apparatus membrane protein n=1 Tax=Acrasis kona TaxID=1008807 RepID=A0AAW2ZJL3_9EUKA